MNRYVLSTSVLTPIISMILAVIERSAFGIQTPYWPNWPIIFFNLITGALVSLLGAKVYFTWRDHKINTSHEARELHNTDIDYEDFEHGYTINGENLEGDFKINTSPEAIELHNYMLQAEQLRAISINGVGVLAEHITKALNDAADSIEKLAIQPHEKFNKK